MANYYVRSLATGTGTGASWANAYTTLVAALSGKAAGDTFWLADDHQETQATAMSFVFPGTPASPNKILVVNTHVTEPPVGLQSGATITTTGNSGMTFTSGCAYIYGVYFQCGTGANNTSITIVNSSTQAVLYFEACSLTINGTGTLARINIGNTGSSSSDNQIVLNNTSMGFGNASQSAQIKNVKLRWMDTGGALAGLATPTTLFAVTANCNPIVEVRNCNLGALGSGKNLVKVDTASGMGVFRFANCALGSSVSIITGSILSAGGTEVYLDNCDSGATNYRMEHYKYQGSLVTETTIKRTGGASDGTTGLSWKMVSLSNASYAFPLESPPIYMWSDGQLATLHFTVEILHDSATKLKESEVWVKIDYLGSGSFPLGSGASDSSLDIMHAGSDQDASSATWSTGALSNPNKQKLNVGVNVSMKGLVRAVVCLAKPSYTIYVDPVVDDGSGTGRRQYLLPGIGTYLDERPGLSVAAFVEANQLIGGVGNVY